MEKEIDFSKGKPDGEGVVSNPGAQAIVQHFGSELKELEESPEQIAEELCALRQRMKVDAEREKRLVAFFKTKRDRGAQLYGSVMVKVTEEKGRKSTDWKAYIMDSEGAEGVAEAEEKFTKVGEPIIKVNVERIGSGQQG